MAGRVRVDGRAGRQAGRGRARRTRRSTSPQSPEYVSRGGVKLANALDALGVDVAGRLARSTWAPPPAGFTDCLLRRGARRVIALDVGYGQLDWRLRQDDRVHVMERTNARDLGPATLPWAPDLATCDLSFISVGTVWGAVRALPRARLACDGDGEAAVRGGARAGRVGRRRARRRRRGRTRCAGSSRSSSGRAGGCWARPTRACRARRATARPSSTPPTPGAGDERREPPRWAAREPIRIEQARAGQARPAADAPRARGHRVDAARDPLDPRGVRRAGARAGRRGRQAPGAGRLPVERRHGACSPGGEDLILVLGGDGSILRALAREAGSGRAGDRRQLRAGRLPGLDRARDARARPAPRARRRVRRPGAAVAEGRVERGRGARGQRPGALPQRRGPHRRPHLRG